MAHLYELADPLIGELLDDAGPFVIPLYQRGYAWEEQDIDDYISDIQALVDQLADGETPELYFFGAVLTVKKAHGPIGHEFEVVDGQQRLTTFFLTLVEIKRALEEVAVAAAAAREGDIHDQAEALAEDIWEKFLTFETRDEKHRKYRALKLRLSNVDEPIFEDLMDKGPDGVLEPDDAGSPHRLWDAADAIRDQLVRDTTTFEALSLADQLALLKRLHDALIVHSYVIFASTGDAIRAYRLFTGLNDRGHPLEAADLLRTRTLEILADYPDRQKDVSDIWEERLIQAEADEVRLFLIAYLESHSGERAPSRELFREYRKRWFGQAAATAADADKVVEGTKALNAGFAIYRQLAAGDWPAGSKPSSEWADSRLKGLIKQTRQTAAIPLLLSAATRPADFESFLLAVDRFSIRYQISKGHPSPYGDALFGGAARIRLDPNFAVDDLMLEFAKLASRHADDAHFESRLRTVKYTTARPALLKYFLATLDGFADSFQAGKLPPKLDDSHVADMGKADLDHMYAKGTTGRAVDPKMEGVKHQLANLSPLIWGKNRSLRNKSFWEKRPAYKASGFYLARQAGNAKRWDLKAFVAREELIVKLAREVFALPTVHGAATGSRWTGHSWLVLQNPGSPYARNVIGVSYEFPRNARNGTNIKVGDVFVCYLGDKHVVDGKRVFGLGQIGYIDGEGEHLVAMYQRYEAFSEPIAFDDLGGDPRSTLNPINSLPPGYAQLLLSRLGRTSPEDLPAVPNADDR